MGAQRRLGLDGDHFGDRGRVWGITISRLRDGRIVEDYSAFDSLELLKQLGLWRTALAARRMLRALRNGAKAPALLSS